MVKEVISCVDEMDNQVIVVKSQITHLSVFDAEMTVIHLVSGSSVTVLGTVHELVSKIWLPNP